MSLTSTTASQAGNVPAPPRGRASWSGLLRLSLVALPVKAYPAVARSEAIRLNQLHGPCGQRIRYQKHCPLHGRVEADEIVKGFEWAPDQYVVIEDEELENIRPAKDRALALEQFIDPAELDPARFSGRTLYLLPHGPAAQRPYGVLSRALAERGRWALGRVVMSGHRYGVAVRSAERLLSMHVLHEPAQVRPAETFAAGLRADAGGEEELQLAGTLIDAATRPADWYAYRDDTAVQLERLVGAKVAGRQVCAPEEDPLPVIEMLSALKQSVAAAQEEQPQRAKKKRKKTSPPKRASGRRSA